MKLLVTGGCGFIGVNLIPVLLQAGHHVTVYDSLVTGTKDRIAPFPVDLVVGDIRDQTLVERAVTGMDAVVHLAAHTSVIDSIQDPEVDFEVNTRGTYNLLAACRAHGVQRFVMASSNAPLGATPPPADETRPAQPMSPYGASKLAGEGYCSAFYHSYGLQTVVLRFANVYGPHSDHKGSVVAQFLRDIHQKNQVKIYGNGAQTRDFIYVEDLCRAILKGLEYSGGGETFQIATGVETSILELVELLKQNFRQVPFEVLFEPQRQGEIIKNYSNVTKAREVLGWSPTVALPDGLASTVAWYRQSIQGDGI